MKFQQICVIPNKVHGSQLFALGIDGNIYVETHGVCENREVSFWAMIDWSVSPHRDTTAPMPQVEKMLESLRSPNNGLK